MSRGESYISAADGFVHETKGLSVVSWLTDLLSLTKPRILTLLLISTCCPMVLAAQGKVNFSLVILALVGGALISSSACAINCIWDRDIDALMERTKNRPLVDGRVSLLSAYVLATLTGIGGFFILWVGVNPLAALIALFGHLFYVLIYTVWLKRSTPQNIVIGGAAGAVPPVVGWVGITGQVNLDALLLFSIIFLWTPPHFWALALNKNADYQRAGVPMLPVVVGPEKTFLQMLWYAYALLPVSLLLVYVNNSLGLFSLITMLSLGIIFIRKIHRLKNSSDNNKAGFAWDVFGFSLIYLALFFVCLVVDSLFV